MQRDGNQSNPAPGAFQPTRWSIVLKAGAGNEEALAQLCRDYWYPAYAFLRHLGESHEDAADLVQSFFTDRVIPGDLFKGITPRGSFRAWFKQSLRNFRCKEWRRTQAMKRGGKAAHTPIDAPSREEAERLFRAEPALSIAPELAFDRAYATAVVNRAFQAVKKEAEVLGKSETFVALAPHLLDAGSRGETIDFVNKLGMTPGAVRTALCRLRARFRELLLAEVGQSVPDPADALAELKELLAAWDRAGQPMEADSSHDPSG